MQTIDLDTLMQINYKNTFIQDIIIVISHSAFMQILIIVFSQHFDLDQNYIKFNATKHTFKYSDVSVGKTVQKEKKSCNMHFQNNAACVYLKHWITKWTHSKLFQKFVFGVIRPF